MEVNGVSIAKAAEIANNSIVGGTVNSSGQLILTKGSGETINAGVVRPEAWTVGSIFIHETATNPNTLLGYGTWSRYGQGKVLVSQNAAEAEFDTAGETGGSKTHTLTEAQVPPHTHGSAGNHNHGGSTFGTNIDSLHGHESNVASGGVAPLGAGQPSSIPEGTSHNHSINSDGVHTHASFGGGGSHPILQPYIVVYMWKRTA